MYWYPIARVYVTGKVCMCVLVHMCDCECEYIKRLLFL